MAKKQPVFIFCMKSVIGRKLLKESILHDSTGARIDPRKKYDLERAGKKVTITQVK